MAWRKEEKRGWPKERGTGWRWGNGRSRAVVARVGILGGMMCGALVLGILGGGCTHTSVLVTKVGPTRAKRPARCPMKVTWAKAPVQAVLLGRIEVGRWQFAPRGMPLARRLLGVARQRACRLGANLMADVTTQTKTTPNGFSRTLVAWAYWLPRREPVPLLGLKTRSERAAALVGLLRNPGPPSCLPKGVRAYLVGRSEKGRLRVGAMAGGEVRWAQGACLTSWKGYEKLEELLSGLPQGVVIPVVEAGARRGEVPP